MTAPALVHEKKFNFYGVGQPISTRDLDLALSLTGLDFSVTRHDIMLMGRNHETREDGSPNHLRYEKTKIESIEPRRVNFSQESEYTGLTLPDQVALVRDDTKHVLCTMGAGYTPLQNNECVSIIADVIEADNDITIVRGGMIKNCERLFMAIRLPGKIQLGPTQIEQSVIVNWSHTGKSALSIRFVPYVVNSKDGLSLSGTSDVAIRHTSGGPKRLEEARRILGRAKNYYAELEEQLSGLGNTPMNADELDEFLAILFPDPKNEENTGNPDDITNVQEVIRNPRKSRNAGKREKIVEIFEDDSDWGGTQLGAYFALCNFVDASNTVKKSTKGHSEEDCRLDNVWFGSGAKTKDKGYSQLLKW